MDSLRSANAKAALPVEDLARARAFYEEKLGLTPSREVEGALFYEERRQRVPALSDRGAALGTAHPDGLVREGHRGHRRGAQEPWRPLRGIRLSRTQNRRWRRRSRIREVRLVPR